MTQLRVLIVEPNIAPLLSAKLIESSAGDYEITTADNLDSALSICANVPQDVVLAGLGLGGAPSTEVVNQLVDLYPHTAVIVLAADEERKLAESALTLGAKDFLIKDKVCGQLMSRTIKHVIEKIRLEHAAHFAQYDVLTGLATRMLFMDRAVQAIARSRRNKQMFGILFLDLNRFKPINDIYGHETGDIVLKHIATVLNESVRTGDTVARFGGDEFVVMVEGIDDQLGMNIVVEKISSMIRQPIQIAGEKLRVGASIGISLFPRDGDSIKELIHKADLAMYQAKNSGKDYSYVAAATSPN